jgi:hypothetical protein
MMEEDEEETIVYVHQGFYAIIDKNTPLNIKGLMTDGLGPCICLIVTDPQRKNMVLAHIDVSTDLAEPDCGLKSWINKVRASMDDSNENVQIYYSDGYEKTKAFHKEIIQNIISNLGEKK